MINNNIKIFYRIIKYNIIKCKYYMLFVFQHKKDKLVFLNRFVKQTLLITHNLGGGTEKYVKKFARNNTGVLIMSNYSYMGKDIIYILEDTYLNKKVYIKKYEFKNILRYLHPCIIIINSFVSYCSYNEFIKIIFDYQKMNNIKLIYMVHDYHCICPSYNLMKDNKYCNMQYCKKCNPFNKKINNEYYFKYKINNIYEWRYYWATLFNNISEIRCFSDSSKKIIMSVYKEINENIITVIPHEMGYFKELPVDYTSFPMNVGIFGSCMESVSKGKLVVQKFLRYAIINDIKVVIVGRVNRQDEIKSKNIKYIGEYKVDKMRDIIIENKISIVLFPSICPETFSYLISELMILQMPIVCFNYGAQAEKINKYNYGKISFNENNIKKLYCDIKQLELKSISCASSVLKYINEADFEKG